MLEHTDDQIGRLVAFLKSIGRFDNTLFVLLSDNGASQEGGADRRAGRDEVVQRHPRERRTRR